MVNTRAILQLCDMRTSKRTISISRATYHKILHLLMQDFIIKERRSRKSISNIKRDEFYQVVDELQISKIRILVVK